MAGWLSRLFGPVRKVLSDGSIDYGQGLRLMNPDPPGWSGLSEYDKATLRWSESNRQARERGCPCGRPGTKVTYDHGNNGAVPVEWWTCDEHEGASGWRGFEGGPMTPSYSRSPACGDCSYFGGSTQCHGNSGPIGGPPTSWACPVKPGQVDG